MNEKHQCTLSKYFSTNSLSCNWFDIVDPRIIDNLPTIEVAISAIPLSDRRAVKAAFKSFGIVTNEADGRRITFPAASAGKMLYQSGTDIRTIASSFKILFEKSIRAWDEKEVPMAGHRFHFNVSAYSNYIAKFLLNDIEYFVRFTIRKIGQDSSVHASTISEVAIYRKTEGIPADSHLENPEDGHRMPFIDNKIAFFLSACQLPHSNFQTSKLPSFQTSKLPSFLSRLHARMGDFWWYSLMIFVAARAADCLNVFVGLWLVPKYVPPSELGAVMPLTQFASFLAMPAAVFASTFRNELTGLATRQEFGKMKTLMRSVFIATAVFFFLAIVVCHFVLPHYLERIRVAEGSLGMLVLIAAFLGAAAPVFSNALQSLKKFKASSAIALVGAPVRFLTMLVMMPFRAISGYFVGQSSVPAFSILASLLALRKELSVPAEPYWTKPAVKRFASIFCLFLTSGVAGSFASLVESTVLRQRLPEIDSAAYYMITRFSEVAGFLASALTLTLFPYAAELAAKGNDTRKLFFKTSLAVIGSNAILALIFAFVGKMVLGWLPNGHLYTSFWWAIPWITGIATITAVLGLYTTVEASANRFRYMLWINPMHILCALVMLGVTGYGYFTAYLPASWINFLAEHNIRSLDTMLIWLTAIPLVKLIPLLIKMLVSKHPSA